MLQVAISGCSVSEVKKYNSALSMLSIKTSDGEKVRLHFKNLFFYLVFCFMFIVVIYFACVIEDNYFAVKFEMISCQNQSVPISHLNLLSGFKWVWGQLRLLRVSVSVTWDTSVGNCNHNHSCKQTSLSVVELHNHWTQNRSLKENFLRAGYGHVCMSDQSL